MADGSISGGTNYGGVALQILGMFTSLAGSRQSAQAARLAGERQRAAAQFEAAQLEQQAGQSIALGQHAAREQARQTRLLQSKAIAVAAASGAGVSDVTVVNLIGNNAGEGAYRAALELYKGEDRARTLRLQAATRLYEGELQVESAGQKAKAYENQGLSNLFQGAGNLYSKYAKVGGDGPNVPAEKPLIINE